MADTVDMTAGSNVLSLGGGMVRITNSIDLQAANDKNVSAGNGALVSTDILQCLDIPANMFVLNVFSKIKEASTATTLTATLGDGAGAASWDGAIDLEGTAGTVGYAIGGTDAYATPNGKLYATADTIDLVLTVDTVTSLGKIDLVALCFDPTYV